MNVNTSGIPLKLSVLYPGTYYNQITNVPTSYESRFFQKNEQIISTNQFTNSLGPNKLDNLHVDLTINLGVVTSAVPNTNNRGSSYNIGDKVSVIGSDCILNIDYVS